MQSRSKQNQGAGKRGHRAHQSLGSESAYFPNPRWLWTPVLFQSSGQVSAKLPFCALHSARYYKDRRSSAVTKEFNHFPKCNFSQTEVSQSPACKPSGTFVNSEDAWAQSQTEGIIFFRNKAQELIFVGGGEGATPWDLWDLSFKSEIPGMELESPTVEAQSPNYWTTREFPRTDTFNKFLIYLKV